MLEDQQLLRQYAVDGSEAAFGELVSRYINLVYSAALRRTAGDTHVAQDVAQLVFADLARKARSRPEGLVLAGWLHRATSYTTAQVLRTERRRKAREQEAVAMNALETAPPTDWDQIRPFLDEALDRLASAEAMLREQIEQRAVLHEERDGAVGPQSSGVLPSNSVPPLTEDQFHQLLRLRGEVGVLKRQVDEVLARASVQETQHQRQVQQLTAKHLVDVAKELDDEQTLVNIAKSCSDDLARVLNVPERLSKISAQEGLRDESMKQYRPYFWLKAKCEEMQTAVENQRKSRLSSQ